MMQTKILWGIVISVLLILGLGSLGTGADVAQESPVVETRGLWLRPPSDLDTIPAMLDEIRDAGFNAIFVETFYHGFTLYPSKYVPQRPEFKGTDVLKIFVEEAHKRGLQVHCWIETFYWAVDTQQYPQFPKTPLFDGHPDWLLKLRDGSTTEKAESAHIFANPAHPGVRKLLINFICELVSQYEIDGINMDYIRYPSGKEGMDAGYDEYSRSRFKENWGIDPLTKIDPAKHQALWEKWVAWRENQVTFFLKELREALKKQKRKVLLSADIFPGYYKDRYHNTKYQDWRSWIDLRLIDVIIPMAYAMSIDGIKEEIEQVTHYAKDKGVMVFPGLAVSKSKADAYGGPGHPPLSSQLPLVRQMKLKGHVVFCYSWLKSGVEKISDLRKDVYQVPATPVPSR